MTDVSLKASASALSESDVAALFGGTYQAPVAPQAAEEDATPWTRRYERCDGCRVIQPCLMSFCGEADWDPFVPIDGPARAWITRFRRENHVRTVNLCGECVTRLNKEAPVTNDGQLQLELS